jgi:hypothetical protein
MCDEDNWRVLCHTEEHVKLRELHEIKSYKNWLHIAWLSFHNTIQFTGISACIHVCNFFSFLLKSSMWKRLLRFSLACFWFHCDFVTDEADSSNSICRETSPVFM